MSYPTENSIAIIGMSCRFPGGANDPEKLWSMLSEGRNAWSEVPSDRFNWKSFHHPNPDVSGTLNHRGGHFLEQDISLFDPTFFGISSAEAHAMDPQQRLQLETTYEALENAGIPVKHIQGSDTAVYVAVFSHDYEHMMFKDVNDMAKYHVTGTGQAILSNRVSHVFDLRGPSTTIDTGCSGSMVALHHACQSLRTGESGLALVGGSNLILSPDQMIPMTALHILNNSGRCFSFDSRGSGYGRGEGAATVVLKRLDAALQDGDRVRAVICNTGVNQDGKTSGIAVPNQEAQQDLIRSVYRSVGLDPKDVGYVEAHGTGTVVGDAIEINSISNVFCRDSGRTEALMVGSIKPNIGHLESSSGIAGLIKAVLVLENGKIPANLNLEELKPDLNLEALNISIPRSLEPWPLPCSGLRLASVNSFGYGGTNGHAVLASAPLRIHGAENGASHASAATNRHLIHKYRIAMDRPLSNAVTDSHRPVNSYTDGHTSERTNCHTDSLTNGHLNSHAYGISSSHTGGQTEGHINTHTKVHAECNSDDSNDQTTKHTNGHINGHADSFTTNGKVSNSTVQPLDKIVRNEALTSQEKASPSLLVLSAKSEKSLLNIVENLKAWATHREIDQGTLRDLSYTLCSRRSHMQWRCSFMVPSLKDLHPLLNRKPVQISRSTHNIQTTFLFTGQGAQWIGMGRQLMATQSKFTESLQRSDAILQDLGLPSSLIEELLLDESTSRINQSAIAQPAVTVLQIALVDLLESLGITPSAVIGHSSGEIAAAYAAGALTQVDALKVSYHRSFISAMRKKISNRKGAMIAVGLGEDKVLKYTSRIQFQTGTLSVACINSPSSTTVSGDHAAIVELKTILDHDSVFSRILTVDTAYHSFHMQEVAGDYLRLLEGLKFDSTSTVRFISSVTAAENSMDFGPAYWVKNLVSKVRFSEALETLCHLQNAQSSTDLTGAFIEIGPHSALSGPVRQTLTPLELPSSKHLYIPTLVRNRDSVGCILDTVGKMFELGCLTELGPIQTLSGSDQPCSVLHDLPPYAWEHTGRYWHESRLSKEHRLREFPSHDLLGLRVVGSSPNEPSWRHYLSEDCLPWLRDHVVDNFTIFPGSGYLCMAIEAIRQIWNTRHVTGVPSNYVLKDVSFSKALIIPEAPGKVEVQLNLRSAQSSIDRSFTGWEEFRTSSVSQDGTWNEHCRGLIAIEFETPVDEVGLDREKYLIPDGQKQSLGHFNKVCSEQVGSQSFYSECESVGNVYGPSFAMVRELRMGGYEGTGTIRTSDIAKYMPSQFLQPHVIHPATLDNIFQINLLLYLRHCSRGSIMPVSVNEISISAALASEPGTEFQVTTSIVPSGLRSATFETTAFQINGASEMVPVINIVHGELRGLGEAQTTMSDSDTARLITYRMEWKPDITFNKFLEPEVSPEDSSTHHQGMSPDDKETLLLQSAALYMQCFIAQLAEQDLHIPAEHHRLLLEWMKNYTESSACKELLNTSIDVEMIYAKTKEAGVEGETISRIGPQLMDILTGKTEPLAVMLEDNLLYRLYADTSSVRCYSHLIRYLQRLVFKKPYLNVLEIGAGTGGTTLPLFRAHTDNGGLFFKNYDYTDISSGFFEQVQSTLQDWKGLIRFKTLDIEQDPIEQGFTEGSYDLIVASNVLHATKFLENTLSNVRRLLKPDGQFALLEIVNPTPPYMMAFGLLPGWWAGVNDGRTEGPLLTVPQWNEVLLKAEFKGAELVMDDIEGLAHRSSLMISGLAQVSEPKCYPLIKIISNMTPDAYSGGLLQDLTSNLESKGAQPSLISWPSSDEIDKAVYVVMDVGKEPLLLNPAPKLFAQISTLFNEASRILWITGGQDRSDCANAEKGLITGFTRIARAENVTLKVVIVDIQQDISAEYAGPIQAISSILYTSLWSDSDGASLADLEYVYRDEKIFIPRLIPDNKINTCAMTTGNGKQMMEAGHFHQPQRALRLHIDKPGLLDSLIFIDDEDAKVPLKSDEIMIQALACGINFKDVFVSLGQMKAGTRMTGECSGVVTAVGSDFESSFKIGDRVYAFDATPYASQARVRGYNAHRIPDSMSFSVAASVPVIFATAYHSLIDVAHLEAGQTILIHAASGGVGQAAIKLAQLIGAEIFATVGSVVKRQLLIDRYQIQEDHIFSSRTRQFKKGILRLTHNKGVDVVLNSLSGEALHDTWSCVATFGTFVEIGKSDIHKMSQLRMDIFDKNVTFASIDLSIISEHRPRKIQELLTQVMTLFKEGHLTHVEPIMTLPIGEIEHAFRLIQGRKHTGKVVLEAGNDSMVKATVAKPQTLKLERRGTYVVAGGLGDLGRHVARFLANHGAGHIVLLSRRKLEDKEEMKFKSEIQSHGAALHLLRCNITDWEIVKDNIALCKERLPPIRGVIQAAMVLQDRLIGKMTTADLKAALLPKVDGTRNLHEALKDHDLDFFVMLSSITNILGLKGQANYAAGNGFQDYLANYQKNSNTQYISLSLGMIEDSDVIASHPERIPGLLRAGCVPLKIAQFLSLLKYTLSREARLDQVKQIVIGVDRESMSQQEDLFTLRNPMFSAMPYTSENQTQSKDSKTSKRVEQLIAEAESMEEVFNVISSAIARKIAALMAINPDEISLEIPIAELGLDSLIAIELKTWIGGTLQAAMQTSEIIDMPNILVFANAVMQRSVLVAKSFQNDTSHIDVVAVKEAPAPVNAELPIVPALPQLPLPDLKETLNFYLTSVTPFCTSEELERTKSAVQESLEPGSQALELQSRLLQKANDPESDGWQCNLYTNHVYLNCRAPINPYQQFGGGFNADGGHCSQAEQAAIVSAASFEFKQQLEAGEVPSDYLSEQPLCMSSLEWIFNTTREPHVEVDTVRKFPGSDFMIVLRRGHIFKVSLIEDGKPVTPQSLKATFHEILDRARTTKPSVATLTADGRDSWAKVRDLVKATDAINEVVMEAVEACAFIVCLDDGSPRDSSERWMQYLLSDTSNRWSDKTMQYVICENGVSGNVVEHSMVDGGTLEQLNGHIYNSIVKHGRTSQHTNDDSPPVNPAPFEELSFVLNSEITAHIARVQQQFTTIAAPLACEIGNYSIRQLGGTFFRAHSCPPKTGYQLIIQVASLLYFGYQPPSWETVSMRAFYKGRVDIVQVVLPAVHAFCASALDSSIPVSRRKALFLAAAQAHTLNILRASRGRGFAGHLYALQEVRREGEELPSLFTDPTYAKTRPAKIMTDCTEWPNEVLQEGGWVMPDPEHVWVHYDVQDEDCNFFIKAPSKRASAFFKALEKAAETVKAILEKRED